MKTRRRMQQQRAQNENVLSTTSSDDARSSSFTPLAESKPSQRLTKNKLVGRRNPRRVVSAHSYSTEYEADEEHCTTTSMSSSTELTVDCYDYKFVASGEETMAVAVSPTHHRSTARTKVRKNAVTRARMRNRLHRPNNMSSSSEKMDSSSDEVVKMMCGTAGNLPKVLRSAKSGQKMMESRMQSDTEIQLKRKLSDLELNSGSEWSSSRMAQRSKPRKRQCTPTVRFGLPQPHTPEMNFSSISKDSGVFGESELSLSISPAKKTFGRGVKKILVVKKISSLASKKNTASVKQNLTLCVKQTSTPADVKDIETCFGFDRLDSPEPGVSPVVCGGQSAMEVSQNCLVDYGSPSLKAARKQISHRHRTPVLAGCNEESISMDEEIAFMYGECEDTKSQTAVVKKKKKTPARINYVEPPINAWMEEINAELSEIEMNFEFTIEG